MKWLFAVLVALNIIVFGGMVASRITEKQKQSEIREAAAASAVGAAQQEPEILRPASAPPPAAASEAAASEPEASGIAASAASDVSAEALLAAAALKEKEQAEQEAKEQEEKAKKEREEKAKREQQEKEKARREQENKEQAAKKENQCTASASLALDEDDYHRIKGLLKQWPHAAARKVEKRAAAGKSEQAQKTYRVLVESGGDAIALLDSLSAKGFSGSIYEGDVSVGVTRSRSAAQVLISRLATAGFGGARIHEQEDRSTSTEAGLSVAKMQVTFMNVDDKAAQEIQNVVERYGRLNRKACK